MEPINSLKYDNRMRYQYEIPESQGQFYYSLNNEGRKYLEVIEDCIIESKKLELPDTCSTDK